MCSKVGQLCQDCADVGSECWSQVLTLAQQCLDIAGHVGDAAEAVGQRSSMVPHELVPILETVSKASSKLRKALAGQVVKGAQGLMRITEQVSKNGADAVSQSA